ncbi:MAG TPA: Hsp70 family protein, partial [Kofleriaceae bacterium]
GGGTLDVTICRIEPGRVTVLASDGTKKAGRDFDRVIFDRMVDEYRTAFPAFEPALLDSRTFQVWMRHAETAKRSLNEQDVTAIKYQCDNGLFPGGPKRIVLRRDDVVAASAEIVKASIACAVHALELAGLRWRDLTNVLCVGGSTRLAHLREALERSAERKLDINALEVDSAIARGAALHAHQLATREATITYTTGPIPRTSLETIVAPPVELMGVLARGLGVKIYDRKKLRDVIHPLVPKGTQIPWRKAFPKPFRTKDANQTAILVELYEGESTDPDECELLGTVELRGFPPAPAGQPVEVTVDVEHNGTKHVLVTALAQSKEAVIAFDPRRVIGAVDLEARREFLATLHIY